ncbi:MAG: UDP-N-acetylmuramate dehydrogenase [Clostridia bacterium]|nr:UDP-N-acetylmuramate dehydrogenase [Clostridia bacterium]
MEAYIGLENLLDISRIKYNEPMKKHTTVKVGGPCDCLVMPENIDEIKNIVRFAKESKIPYYIIGSGSNLLVADDPVHALIIKIGNKFGKVIVNGDIITAYSGASMPYVAMCAKKNSLTGFEFACGIPGTIGGGIRMNAGAYGSEMSNIVYEVTYLDKEGNIVTLKNHELEFSYRNSFFTNQPDLVILSAVFKLKQGNEEDIAKLMEENKEARQEKQPLDLPNFGSVFRRPEGYFVGKLVSDAGLRGYTIGGAQVSKKHTGFIVNVGDATCKDVVDLIHYIQKIVKEKFDVSLTSEVVFIGGEI